MFGVLIVTYLGGWVLCTVAALTAGKRLNDDLDPALHSFGVAAIAGALWPLLVVGLVELSSLVVVTKVKSKPQPGVGIFA